MALEPYQTSISSSALEKIQRMMLQKKAAGQKVEPWELEAAYKAALSTEADRASQNYVRNKSLALDEKKFASDVDYRDRALESGEKASTMGAVGNLATTGLLGYNLLKSPKAAPTDSGATAAEGPGMLSKAGDAIKSGYNKIFGPAQTPSGPVTDAPVDPFTGNLVDAGTGTGGTAAGIGGAPGAIDASSGLSTADLAAMTGENAVAGGATEAGATLGSVVGGAASALPWIAAWKAGMPILRKDIMQKGTKDAFGIEPDSSNVLAQMNRVAGQSGLVAPAYKEITGNDMPEALQAVSNPAGYALSKVCIIVTACTSPDSEEVSISREYRDRYLTPEQLRGYYMIAEKIVPLINRFTIVKWIAKKVLVDNLIAVGKWILRNGKDPGWIPCIVTGRFLALCGAVGSRRKSFVRLNGETV